MAEAKTTRTTASVAEFIQSVADLSRRKDSQQVLELMRAETGEAPAMWGPAIVGFGEYRYTYASGRQGDWMRIGFSPRKNALTIYMMFQAGDYPAQLAKLGKHTTGKSCLYVKRLSDIDEEVLRSIIRSSWQESLRKFPP